MEYFQYFRLQNPPFQPASPDGAVYFSPTHLAGLATLESGLSSELSGLTLLTGEAGTGKTTLIYSLLKRDYKRVRIAHIDDPKLSFLEIMQLIMKQLNLYSPGSTKLDYLNTLDHLLQLHGKEERIAIIVDEAQVLSDEILEEMRLLSNRGQRNDRHLQLILVGQPELAERLRKPELRQLNQRISSRGELKPLTIEQGVKYVELKLVAQGGKCSAIFEPGALERLLRRSDGIPRKINMLCHNAMQATFYAGEKKVTPGIAKKIAAEYRDAVSISRRRFSVRRLVVPALAAGSALAALLLLGLMYPMPWSDWELRHSVSFGGPIERPAPPAAPGKQVKSAAQAGAKGRAEAVAKPKAAAPPPHPVELQKAPAPPAAPNSEIVKTTPPARVGAIASVSAANTLSAVTQKPAAPRPRSEITVRHGDTLEKLAVRYLGSDEGLNQLVAANPQLTDINQLSVGQIIYLPSGTARRASDEPTATARAVSNAANSPQQ